MLAYVGAGHREGVVLADEADGVLAAAGVDEGDIAGDVDAGRTQGHAGDGVFQVAQAAVVVDVLPVVVREAADPVEHQLGGVAANGAGGGGGDGLGGLLDELHVPGLGPPLQHIPQQDGQLAQAHPAGDALPAGLGVAEVEKVHGHVHRTQTWRRCGDAALHVVVELVNHHLRLVRGFDV